MVEHCVPGGVRGGNRWTYEDYPAAGTSISAGIGHGAHVGGQRGGISLRPARRGFTALPCCFPVGGGVGRELVHPICRHGFLLKNIACQRFLLCPEYDRHRDGPGVASGELHILFGATGGNSPWGHWVHAMHAVLHGIGHYSLVWPPSHSRHHAAIRTFERR